MAEQPPRPEPLIKTFIDSGRARDVNLFIATPCYGGLVHEGYLRSMCKLQLQLQRLGIPFYLATLGNESLITRARNTLVARFLGNEEFTHLLFIDADISFKPRAVLRLLAADREVIGGCCPMKGFDWERIKKAVRENPEISARELEEAGLQYAVNFLAEEGRGLIRAPIERGFVRVRHLGTGFLLIKRSVFETMIEKYPDDRYKNDIAGYATEETKDNFWLFFDTLVHPESHRYLGEDYAFCNKWLRCGGEIWMDLMSTLSHTGNTQFRGNAYPVFRHRLEPRE